MKWLIGSFLLLFTLGLSAQTSRIGALNLDHFTQREKVSSAALLKYIPEKFLEHPESGLMPFDAPPCDNCVELIDRRDAYTRYFVETGKGKNKFISEVANAPINFKDAAGRWMEINYRLGKKDEKVFAADHQPFPVLIHLEKKKITLGKAGQSLQAAFPELYWRDDKGMELLLGAADLSNYSAGDEGVKIKDIYPGIDLLILVRRGEFETNFVINQPLPFRNGTLVLRQQLELAPGYSLVQEDDAGPAARDILIRDQENRAAFLIPKGYAFGDDSSSPPLLLTSLVEPGNDLVFSVPVEWLTDPARIYPVTIDPIVTTLNTLSAASIAGTRYSPVCWTNGCDYFLSVPTPPNATITGVYHSFEYYATGLCFADDGGYSIDFLGCHTPAAAPGVYTSPVHATNAYFTVDTVHIPEFVPCFPAAQCVSQNLDFILHFFRCNNDPDTSCSGNCIRATKPWIMYVEGNTVEVSYISPSLQLCEGDTARLVTTPQYGVAPYSYSWSPGSGTSDTIFVSPAVTTIYTATITDACGVTASSTTTVIVTNNNNPGFTIVPNPVCQNSPVNLNGNGAGPVSDYDWIVSGSSAPGGIVNDNKNPQVTYTLPGSYDIILTYGSCAFRDTQQVTVSGYQTVDVSIAAQPSLTICAGDTITFHALPVNGGTAPTYDWLIDSILYQSGPSDSLVTNVLNNGTMVQAVIHSNAGCTVSPNDTATVFITISNALTPQVTISPDTAVCPGSPVTFYTTVINGGSNPMYQWFTNGVPIPGANAPTYTLTVNPPDTLINVQVLSSLNCVTTPGAIDNQEIQLYSNVFAGVALTADPPGSICQGDSIVYTAHPVYGGSNPQFAWYVNGVAAAATDSAFTYFPNNNDSVSVTMTSSIACAAVNTDDDYNIASVTAAVSPSVTLTASPGLTVCQGDTLVVTASAVNAGSNPVYAWSVNGNPAGTNDSILTLYPTANETVQVIVTTSLSCAPSSSDTGMAAFLVTGSVSPFVIISLSAGPVCEGEPVQLIANATNGGAAPAIQWLVNGVASGLNNDTVVMTSLNNGDTVEVILTSSISCVSPPGPVSAQQIVSLQPRVTPDITISSSPPDSICLGQPVHLQASVVNGGTAPAITWYINSQALAANTAVFTPQSLSQGDIIMARVVSNASCLSEPEDTSNLVRIAFRRPLNVTLTSGLMECAGIPTVITAHPTGGNGGPYELTWSDGTTGTDSIVVAPGWDTRVAVTVNDNCTLLPATDTLAVPILPSPLAEYYYYNPFEGAFLNTVQFVNSSTHADSWLWYFPDSNTTSTDWNPKHTFPAPGVYEVKLFTLNNSGCTDSVTYQVLVGEELAIFYPNSFTPNGDGANDFFRPLGASLEEYELLIYNRWGKIIYRGDNSSAWDGRINNSSVPAPEGVYIFRLALKFENRPDEVLTGRVTLIR
jgi:gliding motility-associated-like protein